MTETKEIVLAEERDRVIDAAQELADRAAETDPSTDLYDDLVSRGNRLDTHRRAIEWALDEWDVESITFRALTLGDDARIADQMNGRGSNPGSERNWEIALGTYDAPYLEHDPEEVTQSALERTVRNVAQIESIAFGRWATAQVDKLSAAGNWNGEQSFARLLAEKQAEASQDGE